MPVIHHVSDASLTGEGVMNASAVATLRGLKGIPREAETVPLDRDIQLALATGARYHAAQISCAASAGIMRRVRQITETVSCGVSINNLALNENDIGPYRTFFKLAPPLRAEDDRRAMVEALADGTISVIHSDHDPQDVETKRRPFAEAANGAIGLETMLAVALRHYHAGEVDLMTLLRAMTSNPADLIGLEAGRIVKGMKADLVLIDLEAPWVVDASRLRSNSRNTAFEDARLTGRVMRTFVSGRTVYDASH
jgi:dihydroorotase